MTSPSNNNTMNHFDKLLEETNQPKTLHGVQISVQDWQRATAFEMQDPNIPAPTFFDKNGDPIDIPSPPSRPQSLSRSPTPVTSTKDKGKGKEQHDDPLADDIYKKVATETIVRPKRPALFINTTPKEGPSGKDQDEPVIGTTCQSRQEAPTMKKPTPGQFIHLPSNQRRLAPSKPTERANYPPYDPNIHERIIWNRSTRIFVQIQHC